MKDTRPEVPKALLVSIRIPEVTDESAEESLSELERLCTTLGFRTVGKQYQRRPSTGTATVVGEGKLKELAQWTGGPGEIPKASFIKKSKVAEKNSQALEDDSDDDFIEEESFADSYDDAVSEPSAQVTETADTVVFDCDLTPSQLKNLEGALGVEVLDRTAVIIEIFSRHAKTRAAKLQVEIARLNYLAPRLRETGGPSERMAGRGSGDTQIELDRRRIRDRVVELKSELEGVQRELSNRRAQRSEQRTVALVGYTNAGKSSMMRALTGSDVLVENKLFATLDTTVRAMHPETQPRILVSDTVGFIKKLPHDLVASFRSTLDEAHNAALLLYIVDASDPTFREQLEVTEQVLSEVGVKDVPSLLILNKADALPDLQRKILKRAFPDAVLMSTRNPDDIKILRERILQTFEKDMVEEELFVPYDIKGLIGDIRSHTRVVQETFENTGIRYKLRADASELERIKKKYLQN